MTKISSNWLGFNTRLTQIIIITTVACIRGQLISLYATYPNTLYMSLLLYSEQAYIHTCICSGTVHLAYIYIYNPVHTCMYIHTDVKHKQMLAFLMSPHAFYPFIAMSPTPGSFRLEQCTKWI